MFDYINTRYEDAELIINKDNAQEAAKKNKKKNKN